MEKSLVYTHTELQRDISVWYALGPLDTAAREKIVGHKDNHDIALDELKKYHGGPSKVVNCVSYKK